MLSFMSVTLNDNEFNSASSSSSEIQSTCSLFHSLLSSVAGKADVLLVPQISEDKISQETEKYPCSLGFKFAEPQTQNVPPLVGTPEVENFKKQIQLSSHSHEEIDKAMSTLKICWSLKNDGLELGATFPPKNSPSPMSIYPISDVFDLPFEPFPTSGYFLISVDECYRNWYLLFENEEGQVVGRVVDKNSIWIEMREL